MNTERHEARAGDVSCGEARAELERLFADERFHATERSRAILRYIAERHFEGRDEGVKAYSIALDVLGRQSNFDPSLDPIVRIELSRLRSSLNQYYEAFGDHDGISIELPRGRYIAVFLRCRDARVPVEYAAHVPLPDDESPAVDQAASAVHVAAADPLQSPSRWWVWAGIALVGGVGVAAGAILYGAAPTITAKPTVAIAMTASDSRLDEEASKTRDMLLTALTQFQTLTISEVAPRNRLFSVVLRPAVSNVYQIDMKYDGDGDDRTVWWQIVDANSGSLLTSGLEKVDTNDRTAVEIRSEFATKLARRFAATRGAINENEVRGYQEGTLGNVCVLKAEYLLDNSATGVAKALDCLERTIANDPHDADAAAALASLLSSGRPGSVSADSMERAINLANRSMTLAPFSDRANVALMLAQFHSGRREAAINAGNRALALNPNNPEVMAKLGMVLFSSGFFSAGASLAEEAGRSSEMTPHDAAVVIALEAYRRSDWAKASLLSEQVNDNDFVTWALRAASLGQLGSSQAAGRLADLRKVDPDFERDFYERMSSRRYQPELITSIEQGLVKAGAQVKASGLATAF